MNYFSEQRIGVSMYTAGRMHRISLRIMHTAGRMHSIVIVSIVVVLLCVFGFYDDTINKEQ